MQSSNKFGKNEHLCGEIRINKLFVEGKAFIVYPIRVVYKPESSNPGVPVKVMVTVPKKRFRRAVDRNRIKRLMRESYRLNKQSLFSFCEANGIGMNISFAYLSDLEMKFEEIEIAIKKALQKLEKFNQINLL